MVAICNYFAGEIVDDLEAALEQFREITEDLAEKKAASRYAALLHSTKHLGSDGTTLAARPSGRELNA